MPSAIRSCAAVFAHAHRPVRAVFEYASVGIGCLIENDVIRQIRPQPAARMCGTAACTRRIEVSRFAFIAASTCVVLHVEGARRRRTAGVRDQDVEPAEPLDGRRDQARGRVGLGHVRRDRQDLAGELGRGGLQRLSALRAQMATRAPSRDSASAAPRPSPSDAAVTSATLPAIPRSIAEHATANGSARRRPGVPWSRCPSVGSFPRVVALRGRRRARRDAVLSAADGREPGTTAPVLRQDPNIGPFQGMGVWVDLYDDAAWADPAAAVADMAAHGVHTLYLETSNFNRPFPFVDKQGVAAFVDAAHDDGVQIVAWYLPGLRRRRARTPSGRRPRSGSGPTRATRSTGSRWTSRRRTSPTSSVRTARLLDLSDRLRAFAGDVVPARRHHPVAARDRRAQGLLAGVPLRGPRRGLRRDHADVVLHVAPPDGDSTHLYLTQNIRIIRREVGSDQVPIHVIGGIAQDASLAAGAGVRERAPRTRGDRRQLLHVHGRARRGMERAATDPGQPRRVARDAASHPVRPSSATSPAPTRRTRPVSSTRSAGSPAIARSRTTRSTRRKARSRSTSTGSPAPRSTSDPTGTGPVPAAAADPRRPARRRPDQHDRVRPADPSGTWGVRTVCDHEGPLTRRG